MEEITPSWIEGDVQSGYRTQSLENTHGERNEAQESNSAVIRKDSSKGEMVKKLEIQLDKKLRL